MALGPNDLIPLDQAGLIHPASGKVLAHVPLLVVAPQTAKDPPATLAALAAATCPIGVPDKSAGFACRLAKQTLTSVKVNCNAERLVPDGLAQLLRRTEASELPVSVVPATALLQWPHKLKVVAEVNTEGIDVIALTVRGSTNLAAPQIVANLAAAAKQAFAGTHLAYAPPEKGDGKNGLFVYAGAGIREPLDTAGSLFTAQTGTKVHYSYTGSACLLAQITLSQKGDLFLPGEVFYMEQAKERGYLKEKRHVAYFVPVIAVQKGNPKGIHTLQDLTRPGLRVGLGEAKSCAIGSLTEKLLAKAGLTAAVEKNTKMHTPMAAELGNALKLGSIDAAINWDAVTHQFLSSVDAVTIPEQDNLTTAIEAGVLSFTKQPEPALRFAEFLAGQSGQGVFEQAHYTIDLAKPVFAMGVGQ
ncbi:MAG: substrate-binding domain-containing protein [Armatimonadetes bacterium]|nr:substrate-binding domain-containing protein [Armatimonadota bacterium]